MSDADCRHPSSGKVEHARPRRPAPLTTTSDSPTPESQHRLLEFPQLRVIARYAIVLAVTTDHRSKPFAHIGDSPVFTAFDLQMQLVQLPAQSLGDRLPANDELPIMGLAADMSEAKEVERFGFPLSAPSSIPGRKASELDETGLPRVELQPEALQAFLEGIMEAFGVLLMLEADYESSSPGESHPQALTEPDVNLSAHPALIVQPRGEFHEPIAQKAAVPAEPPGPTSEPPVADGFEVV